MTSGFRENSRGAVTVFGFVTQSQGRERTLGTRLVQVLVLLSRIDQFTVLCLVTWPLNGSEAGVDLVLIKTSLLLLCKSSCSYAN